MTQTVDDLVAWAARDAHVWAGWLPRDESPETIAARAKRHTNAIGNFVGAAAWTISSGAPWDGDLAALVAAHPVRDDEGNVDAAYGYVFSLHAEGTKADVTMRYMCGGRVAGRRGPNNHLTVEVRPTQTDAFTARVVDDIAISTIEAWEPAALAFRDEETLMTARRGGWSIPVGYRTWIADSVGHVDAATHGIASQHVAGGSYLSAPDGWDADAVVHGMLQTFSANGLDKIRHT
ncbi:hypothetical protein ACFX43_00165 [Nocardioides sp. YIM B13467]|uniref:hypothetical protein n=1 Tax=Nocardioides sp. YIM B13467 TaxID=3366294 RepID=UPI00367034FE